MKGKTQENIEGAKSSEEKAEEPVPSDKKN
jgi:hypothetical protein